MRRIVLATLLLAACRAGFDEVPTHTLQVAAPIATETWVHVAVQWNGTHESIYLDGALLGSVAAEGTTFAERLFVGAFLGHVDDFRIYRRALTAAEVDALYTELL